MKELLIHYTKEFDKKYEYKGRDLGAECGGESTEFRLWAPLAHSVELCLYEEGGEAMELPPESLPETNCRRVPMKKGEQGVWSVSFSENMHGIYYDYLIYRGEKTVRTADPYAKACGSNGCRSMVVDLTRTNPKGFEWDIAPAKPTENIIYELHIKDFSHDVRSGMPDVYRGKYKAFSVDNIRTDTRVSAGLSYLKELGVTHVHLLPFFDFGWLDETGDDSQFNWGYDPINYNVPEGSFATDTKDGTVRIRECKEMIQSLHKAGIRVIMDVVYNHTYEADSWLERTVPGYYVRRWENGDLSDGSACGNDLAVGRAMVDNYIVNSVLYWAREYHLDGFRFDLMGLLTTELMNRIREELDQEFGVGEKLLYGEPWRAQESPMEEDTHGAFKDNIRYFHEDIAVFSDDTRDVIKGDVFLTKVPGFVNGGRGLEDKVLASVSAWRGRENGFSPKSCNQIVNYVSAHDNYTLWDKLLFTMRKEEEWKSEELYQEPWADILAANKLAALIYFTCQGHIFFQAGEEFGRTKLGDENSYRSVPEINMMDWNRRSQFGELVEYYKGLIALRKKLPGLYDKSETAFRRITGKKIHREGVVSFCVENEPMKKEQESSPWSRLMVIYNASDETEEMEPLEGEWVVLADAEAADCRKAVKGKVLVLPHSGMVLGRES